jgi:hypothetical protein
MRRDIISGTDAPTSTRALLTSTDPMSWSRIAFLALLSLTVPPTVQPAPEDPLPRGELRPDGAIASTWTKRTAHVRASRVRLNGLGAKTHANWVLFQLPFDSTRHQRIRSVMLTPSVRSRTDVGAIRIGSICVRMPPGGGVREWTLYTVGEIGRTERFYWHPVRPTDDPTILGLNVPTRVANYVACGWDEGHLLDPDAWSVDISWEER